MSWFKGWLSTWTNQPLPKADQWRDPSPRQPSPEWERDDDDEPDYEGFDGALIDETVIFRFKGTLHNLKEQYYVPTFPTGTNTLSLVEETRQVTNPQTGKESSMKVFRLVVEDLVSAEEVFSMFLDDSTEMQYCHATGSAHWPHITPDGTIIQFGFRFAPSEVGGTVMPPAAIVPKFVDLFNACIYCAITKKALPPMKKSSGGGEKNSSAVLTELAPPQGDDDYDYVASLGTHQTLVGRPEGEAVADDSASALGLATRGEMNAIPDGFEDTPMGLEGQSASDPTIDESYAFDEGITVSKTGSVGVNTGLSDSHHYQRAIVVNSANEGPTAKFCVQAHGYNQHGMAGTHQEFSVTASEASGGKQTKVDPKSMLLAQGDRKLMFVDGVSHQMKEVDLERGEVIQSYNPGLDYEIRAVTHSDKFGDTHPDVLSCLNSNAAFSVDTRLDPSKCAVLDSGKTLNEFKYTLRKYQKFTCHATSANGHLAIGDLQGNVRLFSGTPGGKKLVGTGYYPKGAKTLLRGSPNEPIVHLDITADGTYVLATCKTYLLVMCTKYHLTDGGKRKDLCGFTSRMGDKKPLPLRLALSPEQRAAFAGNKGSLAFSKATFEANAEGEHWIAASCGPYIVTWNFAAVKTALLRHQAVAAEARHMGTAVRETHMGGEKQAVCFLTDEAVGMQGRASGSAPATSRKAGKFALRFAPVA